MVNDEVYLGAVLHLQPDFPGCSADWMPKFKTGTVVYVHPERRFYAVEFRSDTGLFRETFYSYPPVRCSAVDGRRGPRLPVAKMKK